MPDVEPVAGERQAGLAVRVAALVVVAAACMGVAALALVSSLPPNVLSRGLQRPTAMHQLAPQGWGFYTRDPREADLLLFRPEPGGRLVDVTSGAGTAYWRTLGFDRSVRTQQSELGVLLSRLPAEAFSECQATVESCAKELPARDGRNEHDRRTVCGTFVIAFREPVPWAWANEGVDKPMPSKVAKVNVQC